MNDIDYKHLRKKARKQVKKAQAKKELAQDDLTHLSSAQILAFARSPRLDLTGVTMRTHHYALRRVLGDKVCEGYAEQCQIFEKALKELIRLKSIAAPTIQDHLVGLNNDEAIRFCKMSFTGVVR